METPSRVRGIHAHHHMKTLPASTEPELTRSTTTLGDGVTEGRRAAQRQEDTDGRAKAAAMRVFSASPRAAALRLKPHTETGERPIFTPRPHHRPHRAYTGRCPDLLHRKPATGQATELTRHAGSQAPALAAGTEQNKPPRDSSTHPDPRATERGEDELQNRSSPLSRRESPACAAISPTGRATT